MTIHYLNTAPRIARYKLPDFTEHPMSEEHEKRRNDLEYGQFLLELKQRQSYRAMKVIIASEPNNRSENIDLLCTWVADQVREFEGKK